MRRRIKNNKAPKKKRDDLMQTFTLTISMNVPKLQNFMGHNSHHHFILMLFQIKQILLFLSFEYGKEWGCNHSKSNSLPTNKILVDVHIASTKYWLYV